MTHTPGPWEEYELIPDGEFLTASETFEIRTVDYDVVSRVPNSGPIRKEADALVIAAVPELLEACKCGHDAKTGWLWTVLGILQNNDRDLAELFRRKMQLEVAAIAKAEPPQSLTD